MNTSERQLFIAECLGFCRGVERALELFESSIAQSTSPLYVLYELVHNVAVTEQMRQAGATFVSGLEAVPPGSRLLIGAHGLPRVLAEEAARKGLQIIDATCQLVKKLHSLAAAISPDSALILLGKAGHPEAIGILGHSGTRHCYLIEKATDLECLPALKTPLLLAQTTVNHNDVEATRQAFALRFPHGTSPVSICNASWQRQQAIEKLAHQAELVLVIGSKHSSNANRLCECARQAGAQSLLIEDANHIPAAVNGVHSLGLSAGASTPDFLISQATKRLQEMGFVLQHNSKSATTVDG